MKKIVVFRNDRFGEFLLIIPALRALRETFNAWITVVVDDYVKDLAKCVEEIDEVLCWERRKHNFWETQKFAKLLRGKKFDISVVFNPTKEAHILSYLAGIPLRVGYNRKLGFLLTHSLPDLKHLAERHELEYNLELVELINARTSNFSLSLRIPEKIQKRVDCLLERQGLKDKSFIALHPFSSDSYKQWPIENFQKLLNQIALRNRVVLIGKSDSNQNFFVPSENCQQKILDLINKTDLVELGAVLKKAKVLISGDSGPVHLASCLNTSCVVLFNEREPAKSSQRWGPWGNFHRVIGKEKIEDIGVEEVLKELFADSCLD